MNYQPAAHDAQFILFDVLDAVKQLQPLGVFAEADTALQRQVLDEGAKFVGEVVAPLHGVGDVPGCRFEAGTVVTPPGFRAAYKAFRQAGWPALSCAPEDGGQGLPSVLEGVLYEWLNAANHGWAMAPALLHGAYQCIRHHGSDELKSAYLGKLASGEWLATMCLTEAHAGSDLGLVRTKAQPQPDGTLRVDGSKIFISSGDHDLTDNIVHLVLARLPEAPPGPKGLSLLLVPKVLPDGARNAVYCDRIEEKMGLHGSPTCAMRFDNATGWLIGEPGRGLNAMFVMMNAARLLVALQGIGLLDAAWQKADAYARERRQMRVPGPRDSTEAADPIAGHPAIRRILDTQRAWVDGGRVLAYQTGLELDIAEHHPDPNRRERAQRWCGLLTPVLKAAFSDQAFHGASECLQVFGGHGYIREWGIEQIVRDSRITMIYEGTNEIQAIDLLMRKVLPDGGAAICTLLETLEGGLDHARLGEAKILIGLRHLRSATLALVVAAKDDTQLPYWIAGDYLRAAAIVLLGWAWMRIGRVATEGDERWSAPAQAYCNWVAPELAMRLAIIEARIADCGVKASHRTTTPASPGSR